jgi:hypothetical protein
MAFDKFDRHSDGLFLCPQLPSLLQLCCNSWLEIMAGNHGSDLPTMPSDARNGRRARAAD